MSDKTRSQPLTFTFYLIKHYYYFLLPHFGICQIPVVDEFQCHQNYLSLEQASIKRYYLTHAEIHHTITFLLTCNDFAL